MRVAQWRGQSLLRTVLGLALVGAAIGARIAFPDLPYFSALFPAVAIAAFVAGGSVGAVALAIALLFTLYDLFVQRDGLLLTGLDVTGVVLFVVGGIVIVALVEMRDRALDRLTLERQRLDIALKAANAAIWERPPDGRIRWDENFFRLAGLEPRTETPMPDEFLAMVHPDDRRPMIEAQQIMEQGGEPAASDEYRLLRPDGETIWLANHRARAGHDSGYYIGITQDVTRRKIAEERVNSLLRESSHRVRNQFTVISAVARETSRHADTVDEFHESFASRLAGLSRSHDLLASARREGAELRDLLVAHLEPFGGRDRVDASGPNLTLASDATQYMGMAFHELATNAVKHGALSVPEGRIAVTWSIGGGRFSLTWAEQGGPPARELDSDAGGFGTQVLMRLVPRAFQGESSREMTGTGFVWTVAAPLDALRREEG